MIRKAMLAALTAGGLLLASAPASALPCPPPTQSGPVGVGGIWISGCWLFLDVQQ